MVSFKVIHLRICLFVFVLSFPLFLSPWLPVHKSPWHGGTWLGRETEPVYKKDGFIFSSSQPVLPHPRVMAALHMTCLSQKSEISKVLSSSLSAIKAPICLALQSRTTAFLSGDIWEHYCCSVITVHRSLRYRISDLYRWPIIQWTKFSLFSDPAVSRTLCLCPRGWRLV